VWLAAETLDNDVIDELEVEAGSGTNGTWTQACEHSAGRKEDPAPTASGHGKRKKLSNTLYSSKVFWRHYDRDGSDIDM
jgi:hypothetical protein